MSLTISSFSLGLKYVKTLFAKPAPLEVSVPQLVSTTSALALDTRRNTIRKQIAEVIQLQKSIEIELAQLIDKQEREEKELEAQKTMVYQENLADLEKIKTLLSGSANSPLIKFLSKCIADRKLNIECEEERLKNQKEYLQKMQKESKSQLTKLIDMQIDLIDQKSRIEVEKETASRAKTTLINTVKRSNIYTQRLQNELKLLEKKQRARFFSGQSTDSAQLSMLETLVAHGLRNGTRTTSSRETPLSSFEHERSALTNHFPAFASYHEASDESWHSRSSSETTPSALAMFPNWQPQSTQKPFAASLSRARTITKSRSLPDINQQRSPDSGSSRGHILPAGHWTPHAALFPLSQGRETPLIYTGQYSRASSSCSLLTKVQSLSPVSYASSPLSRQTQDEIDLLSNKLEEIDELLRESPASNSFNQESYATSFASETDMAPINLTAGARFKAIRRVSSMPELNQFFSGPLTRINQQARQGGLPRRASLPDLKAAADGQPSPRQMIARAPIPGLDAIERSSGKPLGPLAPTFSPALRWNSLLSPSAVDQSQHSRLSTLTERPNSEYIERAFSPPASFRNSKTTEDIAPPKVPVKSARRSSRASSVASLTRHEHSIFPSLQANSRAGIKEEALL